MTAGPPPQFPRPECNCARVRPQHDGLDPLGPSKARNYLHRKRSHRGKAGVRRLLLQRGRRKLGIASFSRSVRTHGASQSWRMTAHAPQRTGAEPEAEAPFFRAHVSECRKFAKFVGIASSGPRCHRDVEKWHGVTGHQRVSFLPSPRVWDQMQVICQAWREGLDHRGTWWNFPNPKPNPYVRPNISSFWDTVKLRTEGSHVSKTRGILCGDGRLMNASSPLPWYRDHPS